MNGPHINNNVIIFICLSINTRTYYVCIRTYRANDLYTIVHNVPSIKYYLYTSHILTYYYVPILKCYLRRSKANTID